MTADSRTGEEGTTSAFPLVRALFKHGTPDRIRTGATALRERWTAPLSSQVRAAFELAPTELRHVFGKNARSEPVRIGVHRGPISRPGAADRSAHRPSAPRDAPTYRERHRPSDLETALRAARGSLEVPAADLRPTTGVPRLTRGAAAYRRLPDAVPDASVREPVTRRRVAARWSPS
jgi:hypothetical protein